MALQAPRGINLIRVHVSSSLPRSKAILNQYATGLRLVITSANLHWPDVNAKTQGWWVGGCTATGPGSRGGLS